MEYMGSGETSWSRYYELYKHNFSNTSFDVVVSLDDNAFHFLLKYAKLLFPDTPVIFSGVNNFSNSMIEGHPLFTGLAKSADVEKTIDVALKLHPNTKRIFVAIDKSTIGYKNIIENYASLNKDIEVIFSDENNIRKLINEINMLPKDSIVYLDTQFINDKNKKIALTETVDAFFRECDIPIYSKNANQLKNGNVGGMITNGDDLGKEVGNLIFRILKDEKPSDIPVVEDSSHNYVFNYEKLKQFNIDLKSLPKGSKVINKYSNSYVVSRNSILYIIATAFVILVLGLLLIRININKRKLAERLLSDSERLFSTLINSTPNIIYFKDAEGRFIETNSTAVDILNINDDYYESILASHNAPISKNSLLMKWAIKDDEVMTKGEIRRKEETALYDEDGNCKFYDTLRIPIYNDNGTPKGLMFVGIDITDHKMKEESDKIIKELMYYDELRTNFFSNISHELKTPLNLIFSSLQVIELKNNLANNYEDYMSKYVNIMRQNCYRLLRIIDNLIDITKIDTGHFYTKYCNENIVIVIENIVLSIVDYVEDKGISIVFDTEIEEKVMAFDPDAMERIILNLLSNAIKFTPSGGTIEVNIYDNENSINISVKDSGLGIPLEKQSSIFEKFVQVDKTLSRNREGSGIGLSLVKELVTLHGGSIELISDLGKGSEFIIELPVKIISEDEDTKNFIKYKGGNKVERVEIEFSDIYN